MSRALPELTTGHPVIDLNVASSGHIPQGLAGRQFVGQKRVFCPSFRG